MLDGVKAVTNDLQRLFQEVADLNPEARHRYFQDHNVDKALQDEIESLLRFDAGSPNVFAEVVGATVERFLDSAPERFYGPYELVRLLGRGGMGSVHLAQRKDGEVDLRVAIKLLRDADASEAFRARFLKERQILASLNHPGVTRLLDAGHTKSGQPFLVMEYVDGSPVDVFSRNLSTEAKIRLFLLVCDAIAYLHRNLIVHRDLKPSNILIDSGGTPKILDFGIAKILDDSENRGITKERMLTLDYASPEQVMGAAKSTGTDIYSLGVILYELLTGTSPNSRSGAGQSIEHVICNVTPPPLSALDPSLPRDLNFVLRKALRKEPAERYQTVDAFADDLRAVLESRPIKVRADDEWYRTRKFVQRQWLPLSAAAIVILGLAAGLLVLKRENAAAERRFAQLRQLSNRVLAFDGDIRALPGSTKARERIIAVSMEYLDGLGRDARNNPDLKLEVANGYLKTAQVQGVPIMPSLGHLDDAEASLAKGAGLVEAVLASAPARADALLLGAEIEQDRTVIASTKGDWPAVLLHAGRSVDDADRLMKLSGVSRAQKLDASRIYINIGQAYMNVHRYSESATLISRGIELAKANGSTPAQGLSTLANSRRQAGDLDGALAAITEARKLGEASTFPNETVRASRLYAILWRQGLILGEDESVSLGRPDEAIEPLQKAFDLVDREAAKDPNDFTFRDRVGTAGQQLGDALRHSDPARALDIYNRTLARLREVKSDESERPQEAKVLAHSSYPLRALHRPAEAAQRIADAFTLLRSLKEEPSTVGSLGGAWDHALRASADQEADTGHPDRARAILLDLQSKLLASHPTPETDLLQALGMSRLYVSLAALDEKLGNREEQKRFDAMRMDLWQHWDRALPGNSFVQRQLQQAHPGKAEP